MMLGGLVAGHAAGFAVCGTAIVVGLREALIGAALGFAAVVIFFSVGQAVEVVACELEPVQGLGVVLASYAVRVVGIGAGFWLAMAHPQLGPAIDRDWLAGSVVATVLAWTTGVVVVAARQRVPIYDAHDQGRN
jgi:putative ATP synthase protein I